MTALKISEVDGGLEFVVLAKPKASRAGLLGVHDGALKIAVTAAPEKDRANEAIIEFLSKVLSIPKSSITVVSGATSRRKRLRVEGIGREAILALSGEKSE